jgi:hypothetical protein
MGAFFVACTINYFMHFPSSPRGGVVRWFDIEPIENMENMSFNTTTNSVVFLAEAKSVHILSVPLHAMNMAHFVIGFAGYRSSKQ